MVSMLASSAVDCWIRAPVGSNQTIKLVFVETVKAKNKDWLARIGIMCSSEATCVPADCCVSELILLKSN